MKKNILFKTLVDILYSLHFLGLIGILLFLIFGIANIDQIDPELEGGSILFWIFTFISLLTYIIFLRGLSYLRVIAKFLLSKNYFSQLIISNLRKSGTHFLFTGILSLFLTLLLWIRKLYEGKFEIGYNTYLMIPFFLMIIGLFFMIQSKTLLLAKNIKDENDLTV